MSLLQPPAPTVDVRRAAERFTTTTGWLDSRHSFSFGRHYDPSNTGHGLLLVNNDDVVLAGTGFDTHPHQDMEIVTWVTRGSLVHQDSTGHAGVIYPGLAQRMSAGTGILHSEKNDSWRLDPARAEHDEPVHFVQMWVLPDDAGIRPGYEQLEISDESMRGRFATVASGRTGDDAAIRIAQRDASLHVARLASGDTVRLPRAPYAHVFVPRGTVELEGAGVLAEGDSARVTAADGQRVTAASDAEVLVWEMHAAVTG
jgi:quercetin 2,3-dioxygenase